MAVVPPVTSGPVGGGQNKGHPARGTRGVVTLELTASGREQVAAADQRRRQELEWIMALLTPAERKEVTASLRVL